jgi:hypothetical protein
VLRAFFADIDFLGMSGREVQQTIAREVIVQNNVGAGENSLAFYRDERRVAGAGAD